MFLEKGSKLSDFKILRLMTAFWEEIVQFHYNFFFICY